MKAGNRKQDTGSRIQEAEYRKQNYFTLTSDQRIRPLVITMLPEDVPPFGYRTFWLQAKPRTTELTPRISISNNGKEIENEFLKLHVLSNGSLEVTDKTTGRTYTKLHIIEDGGDVGGGYGFDCGVSPPRMPAVL